MDGFALTDAEISDLLSPGQVTCAPWLTPISAASARDVLRRMQNPRDMPPSERSRVSTETAKRSRQARAKNSYRDLYSEPLPFQ